MGTVQIGVRRNHLRFKPEAEFQTQRIDFFRQLFQTLRQLAAVHHPVAERAVICIAVAKPAVVQYAHFDTQIRRRARNLHDLFMIKVEEGRFPVVD